MGCTGSGAAKSEIGSSLKSDGGECYLRAVAAHNSPECPPCEGTIDDAFFFAPCTRGHSCTYIVGDDDASLGVSCVCIPLTSGDGAWECDG
jgi:hypothetical protein